MLANHNLRICRKLTWRDFKFHKIKNLLLISAVILITGLYAFTFLLGHTVECSLLLSYEYSYGSTSHILYTGLTSAQADRLSRHSLVKSSVRLHSLGLLSDEMMGARSVTLSVADQDYAESILSVPTTGHMPQTANEIALDEFTLDSLGIVHELDTPISLQWTDSDGIRHSSDFTLCGWWASPANFTQACAYVTPAYAEELSPGFRTAPSVILGVKLHQPKDPEKQAEQMLADTGMDDVSFTTNLSYNDARMEIAAEQASPYYLPSLIVFVCGFLMIYSIVHVAMDQDTRFFAGLKALGMTPRQIRQLLLEKAAAVTLLALLPGLFGGFGIHCLVTPKIITGMEQNPAVYFLSFKPFAAAIFYTFTTVLPAYLLPALITSRMTPASTLRSAEAGNPKDKKRDGTGQISLLRLALRSLARNKGRTCLSLLSLLLSLLLLCATWIRYTSYDESIYLGPGGLSPGDYAIDDGSAASRFQRYNTNSRAITKQMVEQLRDRPEVMEVSVLKSKEVTLTASDELRRRIVDFYNEPYDATLSRRESQAAYPDWCAGLDRLEETGEYIGLVVALEDAYLRYVLEYCPLTSGAFEEEQYKSDACVLAAGAYAEGVSSPAAGETVALAGTKLQVMASVMGDTSFLSGQNSPEAAFHIVYFVPLSLFDRLFPEEGIRQLAVNIDHDQQETFEKYLQSYEQGLNRGVGIWLRSEQQETFRQARLNEVLPELIVGIVLMGVGLLHFINLLVTKTIVRKKEFAIYQSLGMTERQLKLLLITEGLLHAALLFMVLLSVIFPVTWYGMPIVFSRLNTWCMTYHYTLAPLWVSLPLLLFSALTVPLACFRLVVKGSITGRLQIFA